jgi:hypothetical protein
MPQPRVCYSGLDDLLKDFGMTFQIALISKNGAVLGSDRRFIERIPPDSQNSTSRRRTLYQPTYAKKARISANRNVVCVFAGGGYSQTIADNIVLDCDPTGLTDAEWGRCLRTAGSDLPEYRGEFISDEVIVIRTDNISSAVKVVRQSSDPPTLTPFDSYISAGIDADARVLPRLFWHADMTINQLHTLAVVTVMLVCQENPTLVGGGVDVVAINNDKNIQEFYHAEEAAKKICQDFMQRVWA